LIAFPWALLGNATVPVAETFISSGLPPSVGFLFKAAGLASMFITASTKLAIDNYIAAGDIKGMIYLTLVFAALTVAIYFINRKRVTMMTGMGQRMLYNMRMDLFQHIEGLSFTFFDSRPAGKIMMRLVNDVNSLNDLLTNGLINVINDFIMLIAIIVIMFSMNVRLTLVSFLLLPALVAIMLVCAVL